MVSAAFEPVVHDPSFAAGFATFTAKFRVGTTPLVASAAAPPVALQTIAYGGVAVVRDAPDPARRRTYLVVQRNIYDISKVTHGCAKRHSTRFASPSSKS